MHVESDRNLMIFKILAQVTEMPAQPSFTRHQDMKPYETLCFNLTHNKLRKYILLPEEGNYIFFSLQFCFLVVLCLPEVPAQLCNCMMEKI